MGRPISHWCGYPTASGKPCRHRVLDAGYHCGIHESARVKAVVGEVVSTGPCKMIQSEPDVWRCEVHHTAAWGTALALGAQLPCRIPLADRHLVSLAKKRHLADSTLRLLQNANGTVRKVVAARKDLPVAVAAQLAADSAASVRMALARNRYATSYPSVRELLAHDADVRIRNELASNLVVGELVYQQLARDADPQVRAGLASNPHCPPDIRRSLESDPSTHVQLALAIYAKSYPS